MFATRFHVAAHTPALRALLGAEATGYVYVSDVVGTELATTCGRVAVTAAAVLAAAAQDDAPPTTGFVFGAERRRAFGPARSY